jgi:hypothetical protein
VSDKRVPEAEAARNVGDAKEVESQQLVDGVHRRSLRRRSRCRGKLRFEWITGHGSSFEDTAPALGQEGQLFAQ